MAHHIALNACRRAFGMHWPLRNSAGLHTIVRRKAFGKGAAFDYERLMMASDMRTPLLSVMQGWRLPRGFVKLLRSHRP